MHHTFMRTNLLFGVKQHNKTDMNIDCANDTMGDLYECAYDEGEHMEYPIFLDVFDGYFSDSGIEQDSLCHSDDLRTKRARAEDGADERLGCKSELETKLDEAGANPTPVAPSYTADLRHITMSEEACEVHTQHAPSCVLEDTMLARAVPVVSIPFPLMVPKLDSEDNAEDAKIAECTPPEERNRRLIEMQERQDLALINSVIRGDVEGYLGALSSGASLTTRGPNGKPLIHIAAEHSSYHMVKVMVESGIDVRPVSDVSTFLNALHLAAAREEVGIITLLVEAKISCSQEREERF